MFYQQRYKSPLGNLTMLANESSLIGLWLEEQAYYGGNYELEKVPFANHPILQQTKQWLDAYFQGKNPSLNALSLDPQGTDYQRLVFQVLCTIPYGETVSYKRVAEKIRTDYGRVTSARAVGGAVKHNPVSIIIPCHRVIGNNGAMTGYAGGLKRKSKLLELEGIACSRDRRW